MFKFNVEGCKFEIVVTDHASARMRQRNVMKYASYGTIVAIGEELLDLCNGDEFCILDKELDIAVVCAVRYEKDRKGLPVIEIHIVTVLDSSSFYVKAGTRVYKIDA